MPASSDVPKFAWKRRLNQTLDEPGVPKRLPIFDALDMAPTLLRLRSYVNSEREAGREPASDPFHPLNPGPVGGVPLGGLGGGSIMRGWQGDFSRWQLQPGKVQFGMVAADQFSVFIQRKGDRPTVQVLSTRESEQGELRGWGWGLTGDKTTYHALFPRAWTVYDEPDSHLRLTCRQISPVIPDNYEDSSTPAAVFAWTIENTGRDAARVGLMFTFQNGLGGENDRAGGHSNHLFREKAKGGDVLGVALRHTYRQKRYAVFGDSDGEEQDGHFEDPLTFAIAALEGQGVEVTYRTRFVTSSSGMDVWGDFRDDGRLENVEEERPSPNGGTIGAGLCATLDVPPGETREVAFALAWDMPLARTGSGKAYYRRYTRFYGRKGDSAPAIARDALANYPAWEKQIEAWQAPILKETGLPDWFKAALFNELYYLVDGGTLWTDGGEGQKPSKTDDIGHFAYLEGFENRFVNSYDVHFYASFALASLWPQLELSLQRDIARGIDVDDPQEVRIIGTGRKAPRKVRGAVPHDLGTYNESPWEAINAYTFQDTSLSKDLGSKFVLQVYRDVVATGDKKFAAEMWNAVTQALDYLTQFDLDEDGLIENEGQPDQAYEQWIADGPSAYSGGLWLAALSAAAALADLLKKKDAAARYRDLLARGQQSYDELLWNGSYYNYDSSRNRQHNSIMAAQLAGYWYAQACGLPPVLPEANAKTALETIYAYNVQQFEDGEMGAVNGMRPDGKVDISSMQSQEVWVGATYALAAAMLQEGLIKQAWATAQSVATMTYRDLGYAFQTPEAWNYSGDNRGLGSMRPLAIWAMWWAWKRVGKKPR
jgi:non-lysosomal glucosylceramidase